MILLWSGYTLPCLAQTDNPFYKPDSTIEERTKGLQLRMDTPVQAATDSTHRMYRRLKARMHKHKVTRAIFDFLFRDPYNRSVSRTTESPEDPNCALEGRYIGNIDIRRFDPFGPRVTDTLRQPVNWFEKAGNALHLRTRDHVIRKSLMFDRGHPFVASVISDNERLLRLTPNLLDARIYPVLRPGSADTIDLVVVTQDVWSLNVSGGAAIEGVFDVNATDFNFLGLGHEKGLGVSYSRLPNPGTGQARGWGIQGLYRVPYIGKTFVTGSLQYIYQWNQQRYALVAQRNFLTPEMKYAGGLELSYNQLYVETNPLEPNSALFSVAYNYADVWLGRAFRTPWTDERSRIVVAARATNTHYHNRPEVRPDTNLLYQHRWLNLLSIGFSNRNYLRDVLIYGFGRTEDVPYGSMLSFTSGIERTEFGLRNYIGVKTSHGQYYRGFGYLMLGFDAGSYRRQGQWEQGVWRGEINYFSRLLNFGSSQVRQFITIRYTRGFRRFSGEFIDINSANGIRGITNIALRGEQSLVVNAETVVFTPLNIMGFQVAVFAYADLGWVGTNDRVVLRVPFYQGYGLGLRIRNENLAFNTFQIRLGFYSGFPELGNPLRTEFSDIPRSRFSDFDVTAPEVIPFGNIGIR